ncbi:outer membrane insertion C- signal [Algoriphagus sediminis]|uniref:Outer membrane insertion C- signal n=1 Tax=Algoriphagus sediminis TaxID=3057113 RepID=A0ABT7YBJ4_9BACT|nr:outer membrane insertion C- signal [Algoriphagus sediminis]MDN3203900.1 outer membrane insertion C- signal [Algoriphagus sediminis]
MKKLKILLAVFVTAFGFSLQSQAQEVGIRFGNMNNNNVAVDGILALGEFSRIHANVSFGGGGVGIDAIWHPLFRPVGNSDFMWYAGFGPSLFLGDPFVLGAAGEVGIEYPIRDVPITIGVDYRPVFVIVENTSFNGNGFGLNIRWRFGPNAS